MRCELALLDGYRLVYELEDRYTDPLAQGLRAGHNPSINRFLAFAAQYSLPRAPQAAVVDVGAHLGGCSLAFALRGHQVFAFEGASDLVRTLARALAENRLGNVTLTHAAVGKARGRARFHPAGAYGHIEAPNHPEAVYEEVDAVRLDDFFANRDAGAIGFVKIQVEGGEAGVLRGGGGFLRQAGLPPVLIQVNGHCLAWFGETSRTLLGLAAEIGYRLFRLEPAGLRPVEPDFVEPATNIEYLLIGPADVPGFADRTLPPLTEEAHRRLFLAELGHQHPHHRAHAARLLRATPQVADPEILQRLRLLATDSDPGVRRSAAWLGRWAPIGGGPRKPTGQPLVGDDLHRELDAWAAAGKKVRIWWRDDDASTDIPALGRLIEIAQEAGAVIGLAVVPAAADASLADLLAGAPCRVWQHGFRHDAAGRGEFGEGPSAEWLTELAVAGARALDRLFGPVGWQRVFVPPFHALAMPFKARLAELGYVGLSAGEPLTPEVAGLPEANVEIDMTDWEAAQLRDPAEIAGLLVARLAARRAGAIPCERPLGILTHHRVIDEDGWDFLSQLMHLFASHGAVELVPADRLFPAAAPAAAAAATEADAVTVVITSCGRPDLLERTLESLLRFNTAPLREIIIVEDGEAPPEPRLRQKFSPHPIKWLATGARVGQIAAIDLAYAAVATEFIFHCEDDWEFYAPGFIEKSLAVLQRNDEVLQVWIRALDDTNTHPLLDYVFAAEAVRYRLLAWDHDGKWHGFSFNPGLRRRRDYRLLGSYGALDPESRRRGVEIEIAAGEFYRRRGFFAAILADNDGNGYVRHIGDERHVADPMRAPTRAAEPAAAPAS